MPDISASTGAAPTQNDADQAEALTGFAQRQMGLAQAPGNLVPRGNAGLKAIADSAGIRNTLNTAQDLRQSGIQYGVTKGADGKPQVLISGTGPAISAPTASADNRPRDAYGNDLTLTNDLHRQLMNARLEDAYGNMASPNPAYQAAGARKLQAIAAITGVNNASANTTMDQQLRQQQIATSAQALAQQKKIAAAADAVAGAKTDSEREQALKVYRGVTGNDDSKRYTMHNVGTFENGMKTGETPVSLDQYTGKISAPGGQGAGAPSPYVVKVGMPVEAADGTHTFQGKTITVKAGRVVEVK